MTQAHGIIETTPLDGATGATAGLASADLVHQSHRLPHTVLVLTFTDGTRTWRVELQPNEVRSV